MTKEIIVSDVQEGAHGVSASGPWTLFTVVDENNIKYSTFNAMYKDLVGKKIVIDAEEKPSKKLNPKTGKPYMNLVIVEQKKTGGNAGVWSSQLVEKLFTKLDRIETLIKDLELGESNEPEITPEEEIEPPF